MPKQLTHESSIDDLEAWINDSSKVPSKKKINKMETILKQEKKTNAVKKQEELENKKYKKHVIDKKYGRQNDPLYGKKGAERKIIIDEYKKQYEQAKTLKNGNTDQNLTPEMLEEFMNTIKEKGYNPEEIMQKLDSNEYSEEYKNELVEKIMT
tara:strand:- start:266 stop:724 length:459 start_codon:yes stop_codon:yes gene_type:complete